MHANWKVIRGGDDFPTVFNKLLRILQNMSITQQHFVGTQAILNRFVLLQIARGVFHA